MAPYHSLARYLRLVAGIKLNFGTNEIFLQDLTLIRLNARFRSLPLLDFTLEVLTSSVKHLIQVHLEILRCTLVDEVYYLNEKLSISSFIGILKPRLHVRVYGFHFQFVKGFPKCGVGHTWRRTSASLNYERSMVTK